MGRHQEVTLDKRFRDAIDKMYSIDHGKAAEIAKELGLNRSIFSKWRSGTIKSTSKVIYEKIFPRLEPYMDSSQIKQQTITNGDSFTAVADLIAKVAPGRQIVTGIINISGIQIEKIQNAINHSSLTQEQKNELTLKIFSN